MLYGVPYTVQRTFEKDLEAFAALGFDYVEFHPMHPSPDASILSIAPDSLLRALEHCGLQIVCHLPDFLIKADQVPAVKAASVQEILKALDLASSLGALKAVLHPGFVTGLGTFERPRAGQLVIESLPVFVERAEDLGLCLCIENMWPRANSLVDPQDFEEVFARFPSLRLCLDTGHANIGAFGKRKTLEFIRKFRYWLKHFHASDNLGKSDDHLPIGAGTVDFPAIAKALKEARYDGTVTFEIDSRNHAVLKATRDRFDAMVHGAVAGS
jgi:sugar phosphate isomerase/epimerase